MDQGLQLEFVGIAGLLVIIVTNTKKNGNFHSQDNKTIQLRRVSWHLKIALLLLLLLKDVRMMQF